MNKKNYSKELIKVRDKLVEAQAEYDAAINNVIGEGRAVIKDCLKEHGLDGDVINLQSHQRGVLVINECRKPLNGDFTVSFLPYRKDGAKYTVPTARSTIIPHEEGTIKVMLEKYVKAPAEKPDNE